MKAFTLPIFKFGVFLFAASLLTLGCNGNLEKILPKKDGKWNIDSQYTAVYHFDSLQTEDTDYNPGFFEFTDDGKGRSVYDTSIVDFDWSFDPENEQFTLINYLGTYIYNVLESSHKTQDWENIISWGNGETRTEVRLMLSRAN